MRISLVSAAIALAATIVVALCTLNGLSRIGETFPGFLLWDNLYVAAVGEPSWTGVTSGVRYQSWLTDVDGRRVTRADDVSEALRNRKPGEPLSYTFARDAVSERISVPLMKLGARAWTAVFGIYLLNAVVLLLLGV